MILSRRHILKRDNNFDSRKWAASCSSGQKISIPSSRRETKIPKRVDLKKGNLRGGGGGFANKIAELLFVLWQWLTVDYLVRK